MTLGELIDLLKPLRQDACVYIEGPVRLTPGGVASYRGYYRDLAIGVNAAGLAPSVADFLKELEAAIDAVFSGYKGGNYRMTRATRVWFSNVGECSDHGPTGIASRERDDCTVVLTYGLVEP